MVKEDNAIYAKYPERVCYVCGRADEDLKILFSEQIKELDSKTEILENEGKRISSKYKEYLVKMLKDTEKSNYLELKVDVIKTDLFEFRKTIPHLDDLFRIANNDRESISEIRDRIEKAVENSDDFEIYNAVKLYSRGRSLSEEPELKREWKHNAYTIDKTKNEIDSIKSEKKEHELKEYTIDFKDIYNINYGELSSGGITVFVCPICAMMFSKASQAAYEVINRDD